MHPITNWHCLHCWGGVQGLRNPIDDDGGIRPGSAHPWILQLQFDVRAMAMVDDWEGLIDTVTLPDLRINLVLLFTKYLDDFLALDMTQMRRVFISNAIPPPMSVVEELLTAVPGAEAGEGRGSYTCELIIAGGDVCGAVYRTLKGLAQHQRLARGGTHGSRCYLKLIIRNPICPLCEHI